MKLYNKIMCGVAATLSMVALQSCSEEKATLSGAKTVYIEMSPKDISMAVGDTVYLSAAISNEAGDAINTPITWSVDNEDVVRLTEIVTKKAKGSRAEGEEAGEGEGNEGENPDEPGLDDPLNPNPTPEVVDSIEIRRWAIIAQVGAQNKSTNVRATLENGMYGVAPVSVMARDVTKAVKALTTFKRSYSRQRNDTVWFSVTPFQLVDEAQVKFEMNLTEKITEDPTEGEWSGKFANPKLYIDRANKRVGVVYTGPRLTGKGECKLWLEDGEFSSDVASVPIYVYPLIWPGFEVDGKRPGYGPPTPSNIKQLLMTTTMDVNSTFNVGVCLGVDAGSDVDIENVKAAEKAGYMKWTIDGSAVVVEDTYWDLNYESGYVSYLKVRSGQRSGLSVIKYYMPDTVLTCNLSVDDYNKSFPVDRIVVRNGSGEDAVELSEAQFYLGLPATLDISVEPEASYTFHVPEVTVADPSILEVQPIADAAGYTRTFTLKRLGTTTITITSLDKTLTIPVTVNDRVDNVGWDNSNPSEIYVGTSATIKANPRMASGAALTHDVEWTVSDESIARLTPTGKIGEAVVEGLKEGTVDIYAKYDDATSQRYTLTVKAAADVLASEYAERGETLSIGDAGDGTFYLTIGDNMDVFATVPFVEEGVFAGTFSGSDCYVELQGNAFDGCVYNLTIVDNGDGTCTITGTITMANGGRVVMNGETFTVE